MVRRSLGVALWSLAGLLACFLGALSALVGTGPGRRLLARVTEGGVARALAGTIEVGEVRGTLLTGLTFTDVRLFDAETTLVAWLPRAELSYNPFDIAAGRILLLELRLERPFINLVQHRNGRLNLEELLKLGGPASTDAKRAPPAPSARSSSAPSSPPLVLFRNLDIADGTLVLRLLDRESPGDSLLEIDPGVRGAGRAGAGPNGGGAVRRRVRRFDGLNAQMATLRLSSPGERGILADIQRLAVTMSDPVVELRDVRGRLLVLGDSLELDFERLALPGSSLAGRGRVRWPRDTLLYDLDLVADSATLTDFRFIDRRFPAGAVLSGGLDLQSRGSRVLEVRLDPLHVKYRGGSLSGRVTAVSVAGEGLVALRQADLVATELDLELARPFLDTLPFAGRLTGRTVADGRLDALALEVDWAFRDSLVEGWPRTNVRGRGEVDLESPAGITFRAFAVDMAEIDLATVTRMIPAFRLEGALDAAGTLDGPYRNAAFSGTMRHRDPGGPPSVVRGTMRLDSRSDTLGVYADVLADSLSFDGLRGSFPGLPFRGVASGTVRLAGRVDSLDTHADLVVPRGGRVRGDGALVLLAPRYGARAFTLATQDVDLARWLEGAPASRLNVTVSGTADTDSGAPNAGRLALRLTPSIVAGTPLDSGIALIRFDPRRLEVDSLYLAQAGVVTTGSGALPWARGEVEEGVGGQEPSGGGLRFDVAADTLSALDSLLAWAVGETAPVRGAAHASVALSGAFDSVAVAAEARARHLRWRDWTVPEGRAQLRWEPGPAPAIDLRVALDSLSHDRFGFGMPEIELRGTAESLTWFARSRLGDLSAFLAGGRLSWSRDAAGGRTAAVDVDSLALLLPGGVWLLDAPAGVVAGDSGIRVSGMNLAQVSGRGRLVVHADLGTHDRAEANLQLENVPLAGIFALLQRDTAGVGGYVTTTVALSGTRAAPMYRGAFALNDGAFGRFRTPFLDGTVDYRDRWLAGTLNVWRSGQPILTVTTHLPLDLSLQPVARRQLPDTISVRARADSVDMSVLEALTPLVRDVRGVFSSDFGIRGTWDAPRLSGGLSLANAAAFIPAVNVRYEDVTGRLALGGDTIRVETLTLRGGEGRAEVTGVVRLDRLTRPILDLAIDAREFTALDLRQFLSVTASGRLALQGPVFGATLTGRGTVTSGVWYFADLVRKRVIDIDAPWAATLIDTTLAAAIRRHRLGPEFESRFLDSLRISDLDLAMGSNVWLRSNEANIQLTGTVRVNKRASEYMLTGTLQAPRGVYRLAVGPVTREFTVTQGTVRYFGTPDLNAVLNIEARHVVHPVTDQAPDTIPIIARIRGTLLLPELTLEAEGQELAQSMIISYLMFGVPSVEDQRQGEGVVRSVLASIYGEVERAIVSDLGVPLDYVEIRPMNPRDPLAGTRVAAGWQVGRKTFLVLKGGFCQGAEQTTLASGLGASLQFRMNPEWRAEASFERVRECIGPAQAGTGEKVQLGFDLLWERRY